MIVHLRVMNTMRKSSSSCCLRCGVRILSLPLVLVREDLLQRRHDMREVFNAICG